MKTHAIMPSCKDILVWVVEEDIDVDSTIDLIKVLLKK